MIEYEPDPSDPDWNPIRNVVLPDARKQPDRSLAIVYAAVVDDDLGNMLAAFLVDDKKTQKKILNGMGPLATFSARIDLGYLIGAYPERMWKLLHGIREVRNLFAHRKEPMDFEHSKVRAILDGFPLLGPRRKDWRRIYLAACEQVMGGLLALHSKPRLAWRPLNASAGEPF